MGEKGWGANDGRTTKVPRNYTLSIMECLIIPVAYRAIRRYPSSFLIDLCPCCVYRVCSLGREGRGGVESIRERRRSGSISENRGCVGNEEWDGRRHICVE